MIESGDAKLCPCLRETPEVKHCFCCIGCNLKSSSLIFAILGIIFSAIIICVAFGVREMFSMFEGKGPSITRECQLCVHLDVDGGIFLVTCAFHVFLAVAVSLKNPIILKISIILLWLLILLSILRILSLGVMFEHDLLKPGTTIHKEGEDPLRPYPQPGFYLQPDFYSQPTNPPQAYPRYGGFHHEPDETIDLHIRKGVLVAPLFFYIFFIFWYLWTIIVVTSYLKEVVNSRNDNY